MLKKLLVGRLAVTPRIEDGETLYEFKGAGLGSLSFRGASRVTCNGGVSEGIRQPVQSRSPGAVRVA
jgi:hypothetical protein